MVPKSMYFNKHQVVTADFCTNMLKHNDGAITISYPLKILGIPTGRLLIFLALLGVVFFVLSRIDFSSQTDNTPKTESIKIIQKITTPPAPVVYITKPNRPAITNIPNILNFGEPLKTSGKTIFVSIASFRDLNCMKTLQSVFNKADHPENIFVGVVQQNAEQDPDCYTVGTLDSAKGMHHLENLVKYKSHIRFHRIPSVEANGPVYARFLVMDKLYQNEDFIFQVDSHTRFAESWDTKLIENMRKLPPKSALTHYPLEYDVINDTMPVNHKIHMPIMCNGFWNNDNILQPGGAIFHIKDLKYKSVEGPFAAAGMTVYTREANQDVPLDPNLKHLFHGEELLFSVRMAAKGYRLWSPETNLCFHFYYRKNFPKFWENPPASYSVNLKHSLQRVKYILKIIPRDQVDDPDETLKDLDKYGINWDNPTEAANVASYYQKFGIVMQNKTIENRCNEKSLIFGY